MPIADAGAPIEAWKPPPARWGLVVAAHMLGKPGSETQQPSLVLWTNRTKKHGINWRWMGAGGRLGG